LTSTTDLCMLLCLPTKCKLEVAVQVNNTQHGVSWRKGILETPLHLNTNPGMTNNMVHLNMSNWWNRMADGPLQLPLQLDHESLCLCSDRV
jgi:hypothetical protein